MEKTEFAAAHALRLAEPGEDRADSPANDAPGSSDRAWQAIVARDAAQDGQFFFGVSSTGIYCRPSCPSRRPRRENVTIFRSPEEAERAGYRACLRCHPQTAAAGNPRTELVRNICRHIEEGLDEPPKLAALGRQFAMSPFHLQRTFKSLLGISPREYADACRLKKLKSHLQSSRSVTDALYQAGYGSSSRFYERAAARLGMAPAAYRQGAAGVAIYFSTARSPIGRMLVAATRKGVCAIRFADSDAPLEKSLAKEFPGADIAREDRVLRPWIESLLRHLAGRDLHPQLPLDIRATAFQRRVWNYLQTIPYGSTRSYAQVARAIGKPSAARAVARACATNPVAVAIPCHRVVRASGDLGGYRWGISRKRVLLAMEKTGTGKNLENAERIDRGFRSRTER